MNTIAPQLGTQRQCSVHSHELFQHRSRYRPSHPEVRKPQHRVDDLQPISIPSSQPGIVAADSSIRSRRQELLVRPLSTLSLGVVSHWPRRTGTRLVTEICTTPSPIRVWSTNFSLSARSTCSSRMSTISELSSISTSSSTWILLTPRCVSLDSLSFTRY